MNERFPENTASATPPITLGLSSAAAFLHMSPNTLRKRAAAGRVPAYKPGKSWVFLLDELVSHLKASRPCHSIAAPTLRITGLGFSSTDARCASALAQKIAAQRKSLKRRRETTLGAKSN
jgi:hypothetical protein